VIHVELQRCRGERREQGVVYTDVDVMKDFIEENGYRTTRRRRVGLVEREQGHTNARRFI
jgi:hypothetical protein